VCAARRTLETSIPWGTGRCPEVKRSRVALAGGKGSSDSVVKTKLIVNLTRGDALCVGKLADSPLPRMRGLMGAPGLPAGEGLLLTPAPAIHTAFMRFPIDALFLDANMRVVEIVERLRPWRIASQRKARAVLELAAGESARRGVEVGDMLELRERTRGDEEVHGVAERAAESASHNVFARSHPLRVLVISPDRHFRTVMSLLLARRNCAVATRATVARAGELVAREAIGVVVLDVTGPGTEAARETQRALAGHVGVVVVADDQATGAEAEVLAKWGPFGDLVAAIEGAEERRGSVQVQS
jgi:uncharacterized protein